MKHTEQVDVCDSAISPESFVECSSASCTVAGADNSFTYLANISVIIFLSAINRGRCVWQGCGAMSLQWGAWGGVGMAVDYKLLPRVIASGLGVLPPARGLAALEAALRAGSGLGLVPQYRAGCQLIVSPFDWRTLMAGAKHIFAVFAEYGHHAAPATPPMVAKQPLLALGTATAASHAGKWSGERAREVARRQEAVLEDVQGLVARLLGSGIPASQVRRIVH